MKANPFEIIDVKKAIEKYPKDHPFVEFLEKILSPEQWEKGILQKDYWDHYAIWSTAYEEAYQKGYQEGLALAKKEREEIERKIKNRKPKS
ncbi:hypothetical protein [Persicobacter diffluens]|uniref:Uncharacterized protein n=1 Tax=Persicobacter diffluens TaxID=981 RepID=A0AAN4W1R3_9BACT|nr:hypothetical protein PEDI_38260 [Persicobacter diffluens]